MNSTHIQNTPLAKKTSDKTTSQSQKICLIAGGTGGHVFPAIALAKELEHQGHDYEFITDQRTDAYFKAETLNVQPRKMPLHSKKPGVYGLLKFCVELAQSFFVCMPSIWKADKVVAFSGYPTFPGLVAAIILRKSIIIHEQNAVLGKVNRLLGRFVKTIMTSTPSIDAPDHLNSKIKYVGMPVREDINRLFDESYDRPTTAGPIYITIIGGSLGANIFSNVIPDTIGQLPKSMQSRIHNMHQVRSEDLDAVAESYKKTQCANYRFIPFIEDMVSVYRRSHLLIARAGASTIAEVQATGCPTLFVPYARATDDHQTRNASVLCRHGGGWMIPESEFNQRSLRSFLEDVFLHPKKLLVASQIVRKGYLKSRIKVLADCVLNV